MEVKSAAEQLFFTTLRIDTIDNLGKKVQEQALFVIIHMQVKNIHLLLQINMLLKMLLKGVYHLSRKMLINQN